MSCASSPASSSCSAVPSPHFGSADSDSLASATAFHNSFSLTGPQPQQAQTASPVVGAVAPACAERSGAAATEDVITDANSRLALLYQDIVDCKFDLDDANATLRKVKSQHRRLPIAERQTLDPKVAKAKFSVACAKAYLNQAMAVLAMEKAEQQMDDANADIKTLDTQVKTSKAMLDKTF